MFAPGAPEGQCLAANLEVSVEGAEGAAGSIYSRIVFTNSGPECVLEGFPGVSVTGLGNGTQLGVDAEEMDGEPAEAVTLAPGSSAVAQLQAVNIGAGGGPLGSSCFVGQGDGYRITPPHSYEGFFVEEPGVPACTNGTPWLRVGAVEAG